MRNSKKQRAFEGKEKLWKTYYRFLKSKNCIPHDHTPLEVELLKEFFWMITRNEAGKVEERWLDAVYDTAEAYEEQGDIHESLVVQGVVDEVYGVSPKARGEEYCDCGLMRRVKNEEQMSSKEDDECRISIKWDYEAYTYPSDHVTYTDGSDLNATTDNAEDPEEEYEENITITNHDEECPLCGRDYKD